MSDTYPQLLSLTQLRYPIIQAPMAGISTPALAAAVSNAGGLGSLGIGASTLKDAHAMIQQTQQLTPHPFNVNVFCHSPAQRNPHTESQWIQYMTPLFMERGIHPPTTLIEPYPSFLANEPLYELLCQLHPAVISFHFGIPPYHWLDAYRSLGIYTMATATNRDEAQHITMAGIDAVIAQGIEAGGHRGIFEPTQADEALSTLDLVRQLTQHISVPIVAAGGLMDGVDMHQVLSHGAVAAQFGTAFLLCPEAGTSAAHRAHLQSTHTTHITAGISGRPARGLLNDLIRHVSHDDAPSPPAYPVAYDLAKQLAQRDSPAYAVHWAGMHVERIREYPAAQIVQLIVSEWHHAQHHASLTNTATTEA